jgi:hypothetical protein
MIDKIDKKLYNEDMKYRLTDEQVDLIQAVLSKGERVELIPTKDAIKLLQVRRQEIK